MGACGFFCSPFRLLLFLFFFFIQECSSARGRELAVGHQGMDIGLQRKGMLFGGFWVDEGR